MIKKYKNSTPDVHPSSFVAENATVIGNVRINRNSSIWYNTVIRGDEGQIIIGENTNIQDNSILHCTTDIKIEVGNNVTVGHGVILHSCKIGNNSLIGMGAVILDGVNVGENCLVGAGSVVVPNMIIPDGSMVLGNPARIKRNLTEEEIENIKLNSVAYVELFKSHKNE